MLACIGVCQVCALVTIYCLEEEKKHVSVLSPAVILTPFFFVIVASKTWSCADVLIAWKLVRADVSASQGGCRG